MDQDCVVFSRRNSRYLHSVLRLKSGDTINVLYGGKEYLIELEKSEHASALGRVLQEKTVAESNTRRIELAFSCVRAGPSEEIFRHGTELGVNYFMPLIAERSNRKPLSVKERWQHIVEAAVAQCGRNTLPIILEPVRLEDFLKSVFTDTTRIVLSTREDTPSVFSVLEREINERLIVLVGPEGGFAETEMNLAFGGGFQPVSLGTNVLRTETAALLAVGIVSAWHDWRVGKKMSPSAGVNIF